MDNIVYLLGAGFSAPAGLPLMNDFLFKAKDQYANNTEFSYFRSVFDEINKLSKIKLYFNADLFNIEEILSIFEMRSYLSSGRLSKKFKDFIVDVIDYHTFKSTDIELKLPGNWYDSIFGNNKIHHYYGYFLSSLFGIKYGIDTTSGRHLRLIKDHQINNYSLLSLNYDMILENTMEYINRNTLSNSTLTFNSDDMNQNISIPYYKLHGSCDSKNIIPPTWSKGINNKEISIIWRSSYELLSKANHIRIIGYSLPETDSYIKYLLKTAILENDHLKSIDILCLDTNEIVKEKYLSFIDFKYTNFVNIRTETYFEQLIENSKKNIHLIANKELKMNKLESTHKTIMKNTT